MLLQSKHCFCLSYNSLFYSLLFHCISTIWCFFFFNFTSINQTISFLNILFPYLSFIIPSTLQVMFSSPSLCIHFGNPHRHLWTGYCNGFIGTVNHDNRSTLKWTTSPKTYLVLYIKLLLPTFNALSVSSWLQAWRLSFFANT